MDEVFKRPARRAIRDLNVVPIIDMFTTVVFFLLLSTSFIALTKLTVPPSRVSTISDPVAPPPLAPKMIVFGEAEQLKVSLSWAGTNPGIKTEAVRKNSLFETTKKMVEEFNKKYPDEKSLQLGMAENVKYQNLIAAMDGVRELMPDVVLISYQEVAQRSGRLPAVPPAEGQGL